MKAFIVLALVACVAARSVDVDTLRLLSKERSTLPRDDLLLKEKLYSNIDRFSVRPQQKVLRESYPLEYDTTTPSVYGDDYTNTWAQRRVNILSLDELLSSPLFREYLRIPTFRSFYSQYPTVFRRYVESPLFQQFWTVPQFQSYFRNPVLFYKYIVPQVQIIAQSTTGGVYPYSYDYDYGYNYDNQDYPVYGHGREVTVGDYLSKILGHGIEERNTVYPYSTDSYSQYETLPRQFPYQGRQVPFGGRQFPYGGVHTLNNNNYKYLLDKIYRTLFVNKPVVGETTQVRTEVKVAPAHQEYVVEPVTGESKVVVQEPRIVDVKVDEKIVPNSEVRTHEVETDIVVKEALLKKLLITKHITPQLYAVLRTLPLHHVKEIVRRIVPSTFDVDTIYGDDDVTYPTRYDFDVNGVDVNDYVYRHKINNIFDRLYNKEIVGDKYTPIVRDLLKVLGHHNVPTFDDIVRP